MHTEQLAEKMLFYFRTCGTEESDYKEDIPSFVRFANREGLGMKRLLALKEESTVLREAYGECEEILCDRIVDGALHKRLDASFSKFLLTARHGFAEEESIEEEPFSVEILLKES